MRATYKNALMRTLYGVLFLLVAVLQTVELRPPALLRRQATALSPCCVACVSMHVAGAAGRGALRTWRAARSWALSRARPAARCTSCCLTGCGAVLRLYRATGISCGSLAVRAF